jgi:hypothetical protein
MVLCIERVKLAKSAVEIAGELARIHQLEVTYLNSDDLVRFAALEPVIEHITRRYYEAMDAFKQHIAMHGCCTRARGGAG